MKIFGNRLITKLIIMGSLLLILIFLGYQFFLSKFIVSFKIIQTDNPIPSLSLQPMIAGPLVTLTPLDYPTITSNLIINPPSKTAVNQPRSNTQKELMSTDIPTNIKANLSQKGWIVFGCSRNNNVDLCYLSPDRKKVVNLGLDKLNSRIKSVAWSPDGKSIAFSLADEKSIESDIYVVEANCVNFTDGCSSNAINITSSISGQIETPAWAPNGNHLAYGFRNDLDSSFNVWTIKINGYDIKRITNIGGWFPVWSPDGKMITFTSDFQWEGGSEIWGNLFVVNSDGSNAHKLVDLLPDSFAGDWSPDGEWIAFTSTDGQDMFGTGNELAIFKIKYDGGNLTRLGSGTFPKWSPDGKQIAYTSSEGELYIMSDNGTKIEKIEGIELNSPVVSWQP